MDSGVHPPGETPQTLRLALLADTHGALDPRIQDLVSECDLAIHAGDIGAAAVLARLQPRQGRVLAVLGNNDTPRHWPRQDRDLLCHLPESLDYALPGGRLIVIHGHQTPARHRHQWLRQHFPSARALVYGHSHRLTIDTEHDPWILNPGAAGRERTHGGPSCLILTVSGTEWALETHRFSHTHRAPRARREQRSRQQCLAL